jgi:Type II secretion system (T2SS), protein E, N-terminal domain
METEAHLDELLAMVARDLGASDVRIAPAIRDAAPEVPPEGGAILTCELPDGRLLIAAFDEAPPDAEARRRRLEMLVSAFTGTLRGAGGAPSERGKPRGQASHSLKEELDALAQRAGAIEAVVIDAHSPVIWGSAGGDVERPAGVSTALDAIRTPPGLGGAIALHEVGPEDVEAVKYGLASARGLRVDPVALRLVPPAVCARHRALPIGRAGNTLVVAMADPNDADALFDMALVTGLEIEPVYAGGSTAAFLQHLDDTRDARSYDEVMAAIPPETRAEREPAARRAQESSMRRTLAHRAIAAVRDLPEMPALHKGGHLRHAVVEDRFAYVARSFAAIYVLILVFDGPFEEMLARRSLQHALPAIERLVAALPPLDPLPPMSGAAAMRAPRRRR